MKVFHGGTEIIERPDVSKGRAGLDFGRGFYLTDIVQQAESWAERMARVRMEQGVVDVYEFDKRRAVQHFRYKCFKEYDVDWLQFIVANRQGLSVEEFDIIEGGVANDRVIDTVEAYLSNMMPLEVALQNLSLHRPNSQICIRSQEVVDEYMQFVESYKKNMTIC